MTDSMIEVKATVPVERVGEFYELLGRFLRNESAAFEPSSSDSLGIEDWSAERLRQWTTPTPDVLAERVDIYLSHLAPRAREFLLELLTRSGYELPAQGMTRALSLESTRALAGTLSTFGSVAKKTKLIQPFEARTDPVRGTIYSIHPKIAAVLLEAFARREADMQRRLQLQIARGNGHVPVDQADDPVLLDLLLEHDQKIKNEALTLAEASGQREAIEAAIERAVPEKFVPPVTQNGQGE